MTDPATGLLVQGRLLGKNELIEHRRLARIKQRFGVTVVDDNASIQAGSGSNSQSCSPVPTSDQKSNLKPFLKDTAQLSPEGTAHLLLFPREWHITCRLYIVIQDPIQEIRSELSRRRMAYYTSPSRDLVFASTPTSNMSTRRVLSEDLMLCPDAIINQAIIEYEGWLRNSISALKGPLMTTKGPHSHKQKQLIKDIALATDELHVAKREEWSRQLAVMPSQVPLPSFVIDNQCPIVDGGQSLFSALFDNGGVESPSRKISLR